jgi:hypothetical protein
MSLYAFKFPYDEGWDKKVVFWEESPELGYDVDPELVGYT